MSANHEQQKTPLVLDDPDTNAFGTFGGVFTPSMLTILGVIMFMRTGLVTGQAGIASAILILSISTGITLLTSLSISAISTNTKVEGGGAYFLISRSLGPEFGGAIGIALFFAQALSVPFYILGFTEALVLVFPQAAPWFLYICLATLMLVFVVNLVGASWAIKAQYFILAVLVLAIVVMLVGAIVHFDPDNFGKNWDPAYTSREISFWTMFAIFFPAVTGIMTGVNMSGDLKDPAKSIPNGTLWAVGGGFVVYLAQMLLTGGAQTRSQLINAPYQSLLDQALFGLDFLVVAGVFAATLSSALGSLLGAPRILQALSRDNIFPFLRPFAMGTPKGDEPRRGLILTFVMSILVLVWAGGGTGGGLDAVAAILTMFFLFTYGMTNMAAFIERFGKNPSFRPRFRFFHWWTAALGALGCLAACLLINPTAAVGAFVLILLLFLYVQRRVLTTSYGDARRGFYFARVKANLLRLAAHKPHPKNWRPTALVLSSSEESQGNLSRLAMWIGSDRGMVTLAQVMVGDPYQRLEDRREAITKLEKFIEAQRLTAFAEVIVARSLDDGLQSLIQAHAIGPLKPNLMVLGWQETLERAEIFGQHLRHIEALGMSEVLILDRGVPPPEQRRHRRVDVWWRGRKNGSLMVILAYLLTLHHGWGLATIRLLRYVPNQEDGAGDTDAHAIANKELEHLIEAARMVVDYKVVDADSFSDALAQNSADAAAVFLGFTPPAEGGVAEWHAQYTKILEPLPTTLLVSSNGQADLLA